MSSVIRLFRRFQIGKQRLFAHLPDYPEFPGFDFARADQFAEIFGVIASEFGGLGGGNPIVSHAQFSAGILTQPGQHAIRLPAMRF